MGKHHQLRGLVLLTAILGGLATSFSTVYAVSTSGVRSTTTRPSASRGTAATNATRGTTPASRGLTTTNRGTTNAGRPSTSSPSSRASFPSAKSISNNRSVEAQRAGNEAIKSSTYKSLTNQTERASYVNWHENYANNSLRYFTDIRYFYMPFNIWNAMVLGNNQDKLAENMNIVVSQRNYRWIKVGEKMIAVPQSVYDKIQVGDKITLVDDNHIKIVHR